MRESDHGNHDHSDENHLATHPSDPRSARHAITATLTRRCAARNPSLPGLPAAANRVPRECLSSDGGGLHERALVVSVLDGERGSGRAQWGEGVGHDGELGGAIAPIDFS
jgi:hypothetical protein